MVSLLLVLAAAPDAGVLEQLLPRVGENLKQAAAIRPCTFVDTTTVEELERDGTPSARETHSFKVEALPDEKTRRTRLSATQELGKLTARLRPKDDKELSDEEKAKQGKYKTAFALEEQPYFRFRLLRSDERTAEVAFEPLEPSLERGTGVATLDVVNGQVLSISSKPSKFPFGLSELKMELDFGPTACGHQLTGMRFAGEGGILFIRMRFRSLTVLSDQQRQ